MGFMNPNLRTEFDIDPARARQNALTNQGLQQQNQISGMQIAQMPEDRNYLLQQREQAAADKPILDARAGALFLSKAIPTIPDVNSYYGQRDALITKFGVPEELLPDQATIQGLAAKNGIKEQEVFERIKNAYNPQAIEKPTKPGWTAPREGIDENGNPVMYRVNDKNEIEILPGIKPTPKKGMKIYDPATGNLMVDMSGGGEGPGKKLKDKTEQKITDGAEQLTRMLAIYDTWKPEYNEVGTRFKAAWTGTKAFLGQPIEDKDRELLIDFGKWRRKSIENINLYIKELTGAQMSEKEADRLRLAQPDPGEKWWKGDDPVTFKAKMDDVIKTTRAAIARWNYYRNQDISEEKIIAMINDGRAVSLDSLIEGMK